MIKNRNWGFSSLSEQSSEHHLSPHFFITMEKAEKWAGMWFVLLLKALRTAPEDSFITFIDVLA